MANKTGKLFIHINNDKKYQIKRDVIAFSGYVRKELSKEERRELKNTGSRLLSGIQILLEGKEREFYERKLRSSAKERKIRLTKSFGSDYCYK